MATRESWDPFVDDFLKGVKNPEACAWCCSDAPIYRSGLCRHCYEVRRKLAAAEKYAASLKTGHRHRDWLFQRDVRLYTKMEELCKADGNRLRSILKDGDSALTVEHFLSQISKRVLRKDLFHGYAKVFDYAFTPPQRKMLAYLLWKILSKYNRKTRQRQAA